MGHGRTWLWRVGLPYAIDSILVFGCFWSLLAKWKKTIRKQSLIEKNAHSDTMELKKGLNIEWVACDSLVCESLVGQCAGQVLVCHAEVEQT